MNEIKFRQAITEKDGTFRWHCWGYLHVDTAGLPVFINPLGPVPWDKRPSYQFTGLKDKKHTKEYPEGQEIYEGDLFKTSDKHGYSSNCLAEVLFADGAFAVQLYREDEMEIAPELILDFKRSFSDSFEIIGNKAQHPNLLDKDNARP